MNISEECKDSKKLDRGILKNNKLIGKLDLAEFKIYYEVIDHWLTDY